MTFLRREHSKVVPRFRIVGTKLHRLFQISARFLHGIASKIESSQIVVSLGIVWLFCDYFLERLRRLIQIAVLEERDPISEVVPLKRALVERSLKGQRPVNAII